MHTKQQTVLRPTRLAVLLTVVSLTLGFFLAGKADAADWTQPYGGCDEAWQAPHSEGADACRAHGWTVRSHLVIDPHRVVRMSSLISCGVEDASDGTVPCSWNFGSTDGNGRGLSFFVSRAHRFHFVWATDPTTGTRWQWVSRSLGDALAESGAPRATTRDWQRCIVKYADTTVVSCPNGDKFTS
jgi:hypothetical protein